MTKKEKSCEEELIDKVRVYNPDVDAELVLKACLYAKDMHEGQTRASGEPYYTHPIEVAMLLADMKMDTDTILTAILHDTVEDTDATLDDLNQTRKRVTQLEQQLLQASVGSGTANNTTRVDIDSNGTTIRVEIGQVPASNVDALRKAGDHLKNQIREGVVVLGSIIGERPIVIVMATQGMVKAGIHSGNIAQEIAKCINGGGGGSPTVAQAGGKNADQLTAALEATEDIIKKSVS